MPANAHTSKILLECALKNQKSHQQNIKIKKLKFFFDILLAQLLSLNKT